MALLAVLLASAFVRRVGLPGWLLLAAVLLVCFHMNPARADHVKTVQRQDRATIAHGSGAARSMPPQFRGGRFEPLADYHDLGVASVVTLQGKVLSFGLLGRVWVVDLQRLAHRPVRALHSTQGAGGPHHPAGL